ncbi:MAG: hypothetical protein PHF10_02995 [Patescibacteria group bacterium]|nr:hypothetical protein [Patescibacteria group bacterium]MDD5534697.1 hypothetical protein [Patescibacteria group bacterium]
MMNIQPKTTYFCLSNPKKTNIYSRVYLAEPEARFLNKFGQLGAMINLHLSLSKEYTIKEQTARTAEISNWAQKIIDFLSDTYYDPLKLTVNVEKDFEDLLGKVNNFLNREKARNPKLFEEYLTDMDIDIVIIKDKDVHFSQIGDIKTYLIKDGKTTELVGEKNRNQTKKFLNVISGSLDNDNVLFFASAAFFDYFSLEKITEIIEGNPLAKISLKLEQLLGAESKKVSLQNLMVSTREETPVTETVEVKEEEIKEKIVKTKKEIKKLEPVIKESTPIIAVEIPSPDIEGEIETEKEIDEEEIITPQEEEKILIDEEEVLAEIKPKPIVKPAKTQINPAPFDDNASHLKNTITKRCGVKFPTIAWKINPESFKRKALIGVLVILAVLFVGSLFTIGKKEITVSKVKQQNQTIEALKTKESDLAVAEVYKNKETIGKILDEMNELIKKLPQKTQEQKDIYNSYRNKYVEKLNSLYQLTVVDNPLLLTDLTQTNKDIQADSLTNLGNNFYILNSSNNYIYSFDYNKKETQLVNNTSVNTGLLKKFIPLDNDVLIGWDKSQTIATFNTIDKKLSPSKLEMNHSSKIQDLGVFNNKLYTLDPESNQIYKYSKTLDGFAKEESWIQDQNIALSDALAMTIDSSIYVAKKTGQILKFYKNKQVEFNLDEIKPTLSMENERTKIFTNADTKYLYLLDGATERLIILSKDGKLVKQFTSDKFDDLKDFIISKTEDKAFILSGTKIYEFSLLSK